MYFPGINVCISLCIILQRLLANRDSMREGQVIRIDVLRDEVLLAIFDFYVVAHLRLAIAGTCVATVVQPRFWTTTSPESATVLHT
jgi:hypothetical protein